MTKNTFHTIYPVHRRHGFCGMCEKYFKTKRRYGKEYFCPECCSKTESEWMRWMIEQNEKTRGGTP